MPSRRTIAIVVLVAVVVLLGGGLLSTAVVSGISIDGGFDRQLYRPGDVATLSFTLFRGRTSLAVVGWEILFYGSGSNPTIFFKDYAPVEPFEPFVGPDRDTYSWSVKTSALSDGTVIAQVCLALVDSQTFEPYDTSLAVPCPRADLKSTHVLATQPTAIVSASIEDLSAALECSQVDSLAVTCAAKAVGGTQPYRILWGWGDGSKGDLGEKITHRYGAPGSYFILLTVTDANGLKASDSLTLTVADKPPIVDGDDPDPCSAGACDTAADTVTDDFIDTLGRPIAGVPVYVYILVVAGIAAVIVWRRGKLF